MSEWIVAGLHAPGKNRPPNPENGSPGTVGTVTGAEIQKSVLPRTTPKYRNRHVSVQSAALAVYDGQDRVGSVVERDGGFDAYDASGRHLGAFLSRREAMRAIPNIIGMNNTEALNRALVRRDNPLRSNGNGATAAFSKRALVGGSDASQC